MAFYDADTGEEVPAEKVYKKFGLTEQSPQTVVKSVGKALGKVIPRGLAQAGGAEIGGAIGGLTSPLTGPVGPLVGAAIGGGAANVAAGKFLPTSLGGDPNESWLSAFGWGAIPEGGARGLAASLEKRALGRAGEAAHDAVIDALDKGANPSPVEQAGKVAETMGRTTLAASKPLTGEALTSATNELRSNILTPINTIRRRLGEPIGKAYDALKDKTQPITPQDAMDLRDAAQEVRDSLIAPAPKAAAIFNRIKRFVPEQQASSKLSTFMEQDLQEISGEHGVDFMHKATPSEAAQALQNLTPKQIAKLAEEEEAKKPPTLDQLRELRQVVNTKLRTAQGGDIHALLGLQQAIDQRLLPHLPAGINKDRELYAGFINRFPWRDINAVRRMGTPRELGKYVFGGTPERALEIIESSTPKGKLALREALTDHVLDKVNPDAPLADQVKAVRGQLTPYISKGIAAELYGKEGAEQLRQLFYLPEHMQQMKEIVGSDQFREDTVKEVTALLRSGDRKKMDAVEAGWQKVISALPEKTREAITQPTLPGAALPVLPTAQEALETGMKPGAPKVGAAMARRMQFTGPYAAGRAIIGSPAYAVGQLMAMAGIATTSAGYRAIMENGGAGAMAKLYASPNSRVAARAIIETLAGIGSSAVQQKVKQPDPAMAAANP